MLIRSDPAWRLTKKPSIRTNEARLIIHIVSPAPVIGKTDTLLAARTWVGA